MRSVHMLTALSFALFIPGRTNAQGTPPTAGECASAIDSLTGGTRNPGHWGYLGQCGASGATALAARMASLSSELDTVYLDGFLATVSSVRDAGLFNASRSIANNPSATVASRVTAIATLVTHYNVGYDIISRTGWTTTLATARGRSCKFGSSGGDYTYAGTLASNFAEQLAATLDSVELRVGENTIVRDLARCARELIDEVPVNPSANAISISYVCGTTFNVGNTSSRPAELTYRVSSDTGEYDLHIEPASSAKFFTLRLGTVDLYLNGVKILTAKNPGKGCP